MNYRRLGRSGLKVSELSLGSWVTYHNQVDEGAAKEMMAAAFDAGVNFSTTPRPMPGARAKR
jgi:aryl-alcohol dehydrogenase-like predicted oxidoreductase